jgi:hypothetical protein
MKRIAIVQSNYIPWKGYFDLISSVDEFVLLDDIQFTRRDWRNRNLIKTPTGRQWLTVPVKSKGRYRQSIRETNLDGMLWASNHWRSLHANYRRAPHFKEISNTLMPLYKSSYKTISDLNTVFITEICKLLNISTKIIQSSQFTLAARKNQLLISICQQAGADTYVTGPKAKKYLDENLFRDANIKVEWFNYSGYKEYKQLWGEFEHHVSIVDVLFNCGRTSPYYIHRNTSNGHA